MGFGIKTKLKHAGKRIRDSLSKEVPVIVPAYCGKLLKGKTVLITGGGSGIGLAIADVCLRNEANVIITGRNLLKLKDAAKNLKSKNYKGDVFYSVMDITDTDRMEDDFSEVLKKINPNQIDILVNNAGVQAGLPFGETSIEHFNETMDTNVRGTYFLSQLFSSYLIENDIKGHILNVCSVSGNRPAISPYMCSKWAEIGLTRGLAKKLITYGIVVNSVAPGPTATGMLMERADGNLALKTSPAGRYVTPEEIANVALFLISDMGKMIVGETVFVTGGCGTLTFDDIGY